MDPLTLLQIFSGFLALANELTTSMKTVVDMLQKAHDEGRTLTQEELDSMSEESRRLFTDVVGKLRAVDPPAVDPVLKIPDRTPPAPSADPSAAPSAGRRPKRDR